MELQAARVDNLYFVCITLNMHAHCT